MNHIMISKIIYEHRSYYSNDMAQTRDVYRGASYCSTMCDRLLFLGEYRKRPAIA